MNNRAFTLSLFMAIVASYFVWSYVNSLEEETRKRFGTEVLVVKASRDIKEMETVNETVLKVEKLPKKFLEPAAIYFEQKDKDDKEVINSLRSLVGTVAMVPIKKDEQITQNKLTEPGLRTGLAPQITPGKRAVAIPISEVSGISKLVKPGDRVDVVAVFSGEGSRMNKVVRTLLQDAVVLSTGKNISGSIPRVVENDFMGKERTRSLAEDFAFTSITLEVDPLQAETLLLAVAMGENTLYLSLRNNDDTDRAPLIGETPADIMGPDAARLLQAQRKVAGQ